MLTRKLVSRIRGTESENGFAMVSVIGLMIVGGIIVMIMAIATMRSVSHTTASRANIQAQTAAQSGVEASMAVFAANGAGCVSGVINGDVNGSAYFAELYPSPDDAFTADTSATAEPRCPLASDKNVFVRSTGTAAAAGIGDASGDDVTVHALITLKENPEIMSFNHALFAGSNATLNNLSRVLRDPVINEAADVFVGGEDYTCHAGSRVEGSIYHRGGDNPQNGNFKLHNEDCHITGDVITNTKLECYAGTYIWGNVVAHDNIVLSNNNCRFGQLSDGTINPDGGDIIGAKNITATGGFSAEGDVVANGNYKQSNDSVRIGGSLKVLGNLEPGFTTESGFYTWAETPIPATSKTNINGGISILSSPEPVPAVPEDKLPVLDDAWINKQFKDWARPNYYDTLLSARANESWNPCTSGWDGVLGTLVINHNTVLDLRTSPECMNKRAELGYGLTIELNANLAIIAPWGFGKYGSLTIKAGSAIDSGVDDPEMYIIQPHSTSGTSQNCYSSGTENEWGWGNYSQPGNRTRLFLYAPTGLLINGPHLIRGQVYGCHVTLQNGNPGIMYAPLDGLGGSDPSASADIRLEYLKDAG